MTELEQLLKERAKLDKKIKAIQDAESSIEFRFVRLFRDKEKRKRGLEVNKLQIKLDSNQYGSVAHKLKWITIGYYKTKEMALVRTDELITDLNMLKRALSNSITRKEQNNDRT